MAMVTVGNNSWMIRLLETIEHWAEYAPIAFLFTLLGGIVLIAVGKLLVMWMVRGLTRGLKHSKKMSPMMSRYIVQIVNILGWVLIALAFLQHMGINMGPVIAGLGITGVILGLAFQETIGNLLSGMMIVINSPFRIGDYIETGSFSGTVTDMDLVRITLATPDNKKITMSNKLIWGSPIVNYSDIERRRVELAVSVAFGSDIPKVKELIRTLVTSYPEVLESPAPVIEATKLSSSSIDLVVRPWVKPTDYWKVHFRFNAEIYDYLSSLGVQIPYEQLQLHLPAVQVSHSDAP